VDFNDSREALFVLRRIAAVLDEGAAALLVAGYASATAFLMFVAAAFAGLGGYAWMQEQERR
jgi:hypothetical protein